MAQPRWRSVQRETTGRRESGTGWLSYPFQVTSLLHVVVLASQAFHVVLPPTRTIIYSL